LRLAKGFLEDPASVERKWLPTRENHVAKYPAGLRGPWQNGEGRRVRHHDAVRISTHLFHAEAAAFDERIKDNRVGSIEDPRRHRKIDPVGECLLKEPRRQCFAADNPMLIGHGEANRRQLFRCGTLDRLSARATLEVAPQAVLVNK